MEAEKYTVEFIGPFSWHGQDDTTSIFDASEGKKSGIYLWTIKIDEGELVYYVGKTNRHFSQRMKEHFKEHLAGFYRINSPEEFKKGEKVILWGGMYLRYKSPKPDELFKIYPTISKQIVDIARMYRFFIAIVEADRRILERIESAFAKHLYKQDGIIGGFQEQGLNYSTRLPSEQPAIAYFKSSAKILGLPESLEI
ncbi:MAG: GIY-YIG nuclease family protein [Anaerolineales bacterium]|nr:GIY-YIG nuclease family protein [Anaerolineales bacterium]